MAGYGFGVRLCRGDCEEVDKVQLLALHPSLGIGLTDALWEERWYGGSLQLRLEPELLFNFNPDFGWAAGGEFVLRYNFASGGRVIPFLEAGVGVTYLEFDLDGQSDGISFNPQGGFGLHYFTSSDSALSLSWRLHHISNAGIRDPNRGINSSMFLIGITRFFD